MVIRNEESDPGAKAYWVYRNLQRALERHELGRGRTSRSHPPFPSGRRPHPGTLYKSLQTIVALGPEAHARLANVVKTTVLYIDAERKNAGSASPLTMSQHCRAETLSKLVTLGKSARRFAALAWPTDAVNFEIPPINLSDGRTNSKENPRITIFNHSSDPDVAASLLSAALEHESVSADCYGMERDFESNRVRYFQDEEVSDSPGYVHIHIGRHGRSSDRFRICDSWQSGIPVILLDAPVASDRRGDPFDIKPDQNVMLCNAIDEVHSGLDMLLENAPLYKILSRNGRATSASVWPSWSDVASVISP